VSAVDILVTVAVTLALVALGAFLIHRLNAGHDERLAHFRYERPPQGAIGLHYLHGTGGQRDPRDDDRVGSAPLRVSDTSGAMQLQPPQSAVDDAAEMNSTPVTFPAEFLSSSERQDGVRDTTPASREPVIAASAGEAITKTLTGVLSPSAGGAAGTRRTDMSPPRLDNLPRPDGATHDTPTPSQDHPELPVSAGTPSDRARAHTAI
jgi:hypothetical protein